LLGLSLAELGQFAEALPSLEKGFHYTPEPEVRRMCGLQLLRAYSGLGRYAEAVSAALELNKVFPNDPEVLYHTSHVYGNYAYVVMENLHEKAPDSIWMLQAKGEASEGQRDYDSAISTYNRVVTLDPDRSGIHFKLGRIYLARFRQSRKPEDHDSAKREFLEELSRDPDNGNASYELAQMSADDNDFEQAIQQFEAVVARFPDFEQALVGLGGVYLRIKMGDKALAPLHTATKLDARDEVAWYRLAQAERSAGDQDTAQKALETYHTLHAASTAASRSLTADEVTPQQMNTEAQP
jgi:tetratricopeptide (TPR) repeat protein